MLKSGYQKREGKGRKEIYEGDWGTHFELQNKWALDMKYIVST